MAKAYALLGYDAGALTPAEADAVKKSGATIPAAFGVIGPEPEVTTVQAGGVPIGIVRFPAGSPAGKSIPAGLADQTAAAAAALRG